MLIRYSPQTKQVDVSGTQNDLLNLASQVLQGEGEIKARNEGSPAPYHEFLKSIVIKTVPGEPVSLIATGDGHLLIAGEMRGLKILSQNVKWLAENKTQKGEHIHVEYFPGHFYLAENSAAVVFTLA